MTQSVRGEQRSNPVTYREHPYGPPHLGFVPELLGGDGIAPLHHLGASAACNSALEGYVIRC